MFFVYIFFVVVFIALILSICLRFTPPIKTSEHISQISDMECNFMIGGCAIVLMFLSVTICSSRKEVDEVKSISISSAISVHEKAYNENMSKLKGYWETKIHDIISTAKISEKINVIACNLSQADIDTIRSIEKKNKELEIEIVSDPLKYNLDEYNISRGVHFYHGWSTYSHALIVRW